MTEFVAFVSGWIVSIPLWELYLLLGLMAFIEGIFPPVPADVVVALGSFLAARRGANFYVTASSITIGSVAGAMVVYAVARRYGADWLHAKLKRAGIDNLEQRLEVMYSRYGLTALFVSRFLPGLRAVTPPMAGATRIPPLRTALIFLAASAIWYGAIAWIAFRVGDDWEMMQQSVRHFARQVGIVAFFAAGLLAALVVVIVRRRAAARIAKVIDEATAGEGTPED